MQIIFECKLSTEITSARSRWQYLKCRSSRLYRRCLLQFLLVGKLLEINLKCIYGADDNLSIGKLIWSTDKRKCVKAHCFSLVIWPASRTEMSVVRDLKRSRRTCDSPFLYSRKHVFQRDVTHLHPSTWLVVFLGES